MLEAMGDSYISQHVWQSYRDHVEKTSFQAYVTDALRDLEALLYGREVRERWIDILQEMNDSASTAKPTEESPEQVRKRILEKLNGKEDD